MRFVDRPATVRTAWGTAGVAAAVLASQVTGWNRWRLVPVLQTFTPVLALAGLPVACVGAARRSAPMTIVGLVSAAGLAAIVVPAIRIRRLPSPEPITVEAGARLTVAHANLLYQNVRRATESAAAILATGADVLALSEFTTHHQRALVALGGEDLYPYRFGRTARKSEGIAMWSRIPLADVTFRYLDNRPGVVATVGVDAGPVRIVLAHPDPPTSRKGLRRWESSLELIGSVAASAGPPTVIVADLNASRWHPVLRRLLGRGWADAHESVGRGLGVSWPTNSRIVPPFVRLDHALIGPGLRLVDIRDFDVPGSDHLGYVVTVSRDGSGIVPTGTN